MTMHELPFCPFCSVCVLSRLEGPRIIKSECPVCHMPGWKNDLKHNTAYASTLQAVAALQSALISLESKPDIASNSSGLSNDASRVQGHTQTQQANGKQALLLQSTIVSGHLSSW